MTSFEEKHTDRSGTFLIDAKNSVRQLSYPFSASTFSVD